MKMCEFSLVPCQLCRLTIQADKVEEHEKICPKASILCPYHSIGCSNENAMPRPSLEEHCRESEIEHALQLVKTVKSAEKQSNDALLKAEDIAKQLRLMTVGHDKLDSGCFEAVDRDSVRGQGEAISEARLKASTSVHLRLRNEEAPFETLPTGFPRRDMGFDKKLLQPLFDSMKQEMLTVLRVDLSDKASADSRRKEAEITTLKEKIIQLEKTIRTKTTEAEDRDFRLSLIENSNYEGNMVWKIPQFSQRKADAESGKYTSIFSLPFYTGRYGYKMCLRLYILGDGIGKNTHMSLFFVVMRGEFDNILQWPFTHKVTFKLINQKGARDVVDTFQPDPMSSSFRKPKSDMNIASGCPRFVSHQELQNGSFIEDDTIFIKCVIDKATLRNP